MKRLIATLILGLASVVAFAQLKDGSLAPDFTVKDLNGNSYNLYTVLNSGKTVFLDVSAAWCGPCWNYHHNVHALEDLWTAHGPTGGTGVSASTTNDVMIFFIEGEASNTTAQLHGIAGTGSAQTTQGDWVTGTNYPIVDSNASWTNSFDQAWQIGYFPTIYMICRDRLVREVGQLSTSALYAASAANCPSYGPSSTIDAKAVSYSGNSYFVCNATPTVKFQNYSQSNSITSATIKTYSGTTLVNTYNWNGNLAPYAVASVSLPSFAGTAFAPYRYDVTVAGDAMASNNASPDSLYKVYTAASAASIPAKETFDGITKLPYRYSTTDGAFLPYSSSGGVYQVTGNTGAQTAALVFDFLDNVAGSQMDFVFGNFNTSAATNVALDFDVAYTPYSTGTAAENDSLQVLVSTDCGATWKSAWLKSGATLQTIAPSKTAFYPAAANQWRHETAVLSAYKGANMLVKLRGYSRYGNYCWVDNLKLTPTLDVSNSVTAGSVAVYPNPARESATLEFTLAHNSQVVIKVMDAAGRTVATPVSQELQQGQQRVNIPTANLAAGVYNISIQTTEGVLTQRLSVVK